MHQTLVLSVVLYGYEIRPLPLVEHRRLSVSESIVVLWVVTSCGRFKTEAIRSSETSITNCKSTRLLKHRIHIPVPPVWQLKPTEPNYLACPMYKINNNACTLTEYCNSAVWLQKFVTTICKSRPAIRSVRNVAQLPHRNRGFVAWWLRMEDWLRAVHCSLKAFWSSSIIEVHSISIWKYNFWDGDGGACITKSTQTDYEKLVFSFNFPGDHTGRCIQTTRGGSKRRKPYSHYLI
jgi:hypothetical protein